jgi:predicted permease
MWRDIRYALRMLRRSPAFTAVAVASLALGIGANTAIFSLVNALILRMLPVDHPEQLVEFLIQYPGEPALNVFSFRSYQHFRDHNHVFSGVTSVQHRPFHVRAEGLDPQTVVGERVAGNFFSMLGVKPAIGRLLDPGDAANSAVAVVSWSYWRNQRNLDPAIVGSRIVVEDVPVTVIGVAPREFVGLQVGIAPDIWVPMALESGPLELLARLRSGVSIEQARAEMAVLFRFTLDERTRDSKDPVQRQLKFTVEPAGAGLSTGLRDQFAKPLLAMMVVVALLLLIACTNLANMLLAHGAGRRHEMAVRVALGAGRFRLMRQVLTESLLLAGAGGFLGFLLAYAGARALVRIITSGRPIIGMPLHIDIPIHPDMRLFLFTAAIASLTGILFGFAPAWNASSTAPARSLRDIARAGATGFQRIFGKSLIVAQVALSVVLLSAAGLFLRNLSDLEHVDLGFHRDRVLLLTLDPVRSGYTNEQLSRAYRDLLPRLAVIPGVRSATISGPGPLSGAGASQFVTVDGFAEPPENRRYIYLNWVAPKYFETLGTPLLRGRDFNSGDPGGPPVAIINQSMARYYFAGRNPIGRHLTFDGDRGSYEIVGVVGDTKYFEIREAPLRTVYLDTFQSARPASTFALNTSVDPQSIVPAARRTVHELLKDVPVTRVTTLVDQVDASILPERLTAALSAAFGALGSLLVAIGIYGLLAYTVARRIREIGIRMALGATQRGVSRMVLREALAMTLGGLLIGVPVAYAGQRFAAILIAGLQSVGKFPIAFGAAGVIAITLLAAYIPARRASRVDPAEALRHEQLLRATVRLVQNLHHVHHALPLAVQPRAGFELQHAAGIRSGDHFRARRVYRLHFLLEHRHRHLVLHHVIDSGAAAA